MTAQSMTEADMAHPAAAWKSTLTLTLTCVVSPWKRYLHLRKRRRITCVSVRGGY